MKQAAMAVGVCTASFLLSVAGLNYGAKLVYLSDDFQATHKNGIRILDYIEGRRPDIYGDDNNILPHPYLLYANKPNFQGGGFRQHDDVGYRIVPQPPRSAGLSPKKVLLLGGSTTYGYPYVVDPNKTWPGVLQQMLGPGFEVINAGLASATSAELLAGYTFRHRYLKPDIVIIHEGGNDVMAMMSDGYHPEYTHLRSPGSRPQPGWLDLQILKRGGWPAKLIYAANWNEQATVYVPARSSTPPNPSEALDRAMHGPTEGFERNLSLLVRNIQDDGAVPVLFGFVQAREENLSRNRPDLVGRERAWHIGLGRNLEIMQRIAKERGLVYLDPKAFVTEDQWFLDNCHLDEIGEAAKAKFVLQGLQPVVQKTD